MRRRFSQVAALLVTVVLWLMSSLAEAQQPQVRAELDSVSIWVGNQVGLKIDITVAKGEQIDLLPLPDSLGSSVEVVEALSKDTLSEGDLVRYVSRYLVTSFDTGLHYVAPIPVLRCSDGTEVSTQEFALNVLNPFQEIKMDEQSGAALIYDIHDAENAPFKWQELIVYWPWLALAVLAAGLILLCVWLVKKYSQREKGGEVKKEPDEPCEVTALRSLERIKEEKLWQHNRVKDYYSELTDTLRKYISARYGVNAMESTTAEIIESLSGLRKSNKQELSDLEEILGQADFVKFAKHDPLPDENDKAMTQAVNFVTVTTEAARQEEEEKKKAEGSAEEQRADADSKQIE